MSAINNLCTIHLLLGMFIIYISAARVIRRNITRSHNITEDVVWGKYYDLG